MNRYLRNELKIISLLTSISTYRQLKPPAELLFPRQHSDILCNSIPVQRCASANDENTAINSLVPDVC
jgi:hypothetical protein